MQCVELPSEFTYLRLLLAQLAFPFRPLHGEQTPSLSEAGASEKGKIRERGESPGYDHIEPIAEAAPPGQIFDTQMQGNTVIKPQPAHDMPLEVDFFSHGIHRHHFPPGIDNGQGQSEIGRAHV